MRGAAMRCIVTGATGFIGKALCRELLCQGHEVSAIIRPGSARKGRMASFMGEEKFRILELPLGELESYARREKISADVFFHLAWNGSAGEDRENFDMQEENLSYLADAIRTAKVCGCQRFVGAGSQAEYGVLQGKAYEDKAVPHPFMMYGATKNAACLMGRILAKQCGITFIWPRIYSVYGVGENPGTLVNYVIETLQQGKRPELSPCENMWNFLYITDCAKQLVALGLSENAEGIYHLASQDTRLLKDFVKEIRDIVVPGLELGFGCRSADSQKTFWLEPDVSRIESIIKLDYVSFEEGIRCKLASC